MGLGLVVIEVVLPTYNGAAFLEAQLASIDAQTLRPQRVIIRDDGSQDGTPALLRQLQKRYGNWLVLLDSRGNLGCVGNINCLLSATRAPYVALADQDDLWHPDKLASSLRLMEWVEASHGNDYPLLVHADLNLIDTNGHSLGRTYFENQGLHPQRTGLDDLLLTNVVTGCTVLINRALLRRSTPIPAEALMHDWWLALVASATGSISLLQAANVSYRQHAGNVVGARGAGVLAMLGRLLHPSRSGPFQLLPALLSQASVLQKQFGLHAFPVLQVMRQRRLTRIWRLCSEPELRRKLRKHGPLRTWALWLVLCLAPPQRC